MLHPNGWLFLPADCQPKLTALPCLSATQAIVQLIESSKKGWDGFFKSAPEWDSNQLSLDYESAVQTTALLLHYLTFHGDKKESLLLRYGLFDIPLSF